MKAAPASVCTAGGSSCRANRCGRKQGGGTVNDVGQAGIAATTRGDHDGWEEKEHDQPASGSSGTEP